MLHSNAYRKGCRPRRARRRLAAALGLGIPYAVMCIELLSRGSVAGFVPMAATLVALAPLVAPAIGTLLDGGAR